MRSFSIVGVALTLATAAACRRSGDPDGGVVDVGLVGKGDGAVPLVFTSTRVSNNRSVLSQGEAEVLADDRGRVAVVWMDGSPAAPGFTLRWTWSSDGGRTFGPDAELMPDVRLGDPTMALLPDGTFLLASLRKDSGGLAWTDVALVLFRSSDGGRTWAGPQAVNDDGVFHDRPWLHVDAQGRAHLGHLTRFEQRDGSYDLPVSYRGSDVGARTFQPAVTVNPARASGVKGGLTMGVASLDDGRVVVAYKSATGASDHQGGLCHAGVAWAQVSRDGRAFDPPVRISPAGTDPVEGCETADRSPVAPNARIVGARNDVYAAWVGNAPSGHALYLAAMRDGASEFSPPLLVARGAAQDLGLPVVTVDRASAVHLFWMQRRDGGFGPMYARSGDGGRTASAPVAVTTWAFPANGWAGDFNAAVTNHDDLYFAWAAAGGDRAGIYLSVARGAVR